MFAPLEASIIGKARSKGLLDIAITDIRGFARDKHRTADDAPYGGGAGMVMKPDLISDAIKSVSSKSAKVIFLTPGGKTLNNGIAKALSKEKHIILICGHYEGIDQRVIDEFADEEISIGDYVLTGGELPAMVLVDALARHIPGVLGDKASAEEESFSRGLLEYPQYTRPEDHNGNKVPKVLLGGNHKEIAAWRRKGSVIRTFYERPDLLATADLDKSDRTALESLFNGGNSK